MATYQFYTSIPFDFLGTIIRPDWENFIPFIEGILEEIDERMRFLKKEIERLETFAEKIDLAEKNQLSENEGPPDIGGINDEQPDETTTEHFDSADIGLGGQSPLDGKKNINPTYRDDSSTADIVDVIKNAFIENIKYRRSNLSYKVYKIKDLIEQYETEQESLDKKKNDWSLLKTEIERRYGLGEYWELRENEDASEEGFVNSVDWDNGPKAD